MALSDRHLLIGTLLACAAIAALRLPPANEATPSRNRPVLTSEARRRDRLANHLRRESATLALLERRDATMRRLGNDEGSGVPIVLYDVDIPGLLRSVIDTAIASEVESVGGRLDGARVAVRVLTDTGARPAHWGPLYGEAAWMDNQYVLPPATDGRTCLAIVRVGPRVLEGLAPASRGSPARSSDAAARELRRTIAREVGQFLGPCAFYGAYGLPGPRIERWLAGSHFNMALRAPGTASDSFEDISPVRSHTILDRWVANIDWLENRTWLHRDLVRCAEGERAGCVGALHAPRSEAGASRSPWLLRDHGRRFVFGYPLGPAEYWLMAGLQNRIGREAFGRFWQSPLEPEEAFAEVTGVGLTEATSDWAHEIYDSGRRHDWPHPWALAGQVLLVGGLLGTAALRRSR